MEVSLAHPANSQRGRIHTKPTFSFLHRALLGHDAFCLVCTCGVSQLTPLMKLYLCLPLLQGSVRSEAVLPICLEDVKQAPNTRHMQSLCQLRKQSRKWKTFDNPQGKDSCSADPRRGDGWRLAGMFVQNNFSLIQVLHNLNRKTEFPRNLQVAFSSVYKMNHTPVLMKMLLNYYDFINKTSVAI